MDGWTVIAGSWRSVPEQVESDVRQSVRRVLRMGGRIRTGGALGVDLVALREGMAQNRLADRLEVVIPTTLELYCSHYRSRAADGVISEGDSELLIRTLEELRSIRRLAVRELEFAVVNQESYYARNGALLLGASRLLAFQVNGSPGTQDAVEKARKIGVDVEVRRYETES